VAGKWLLYWLLSPEGRSAIEAVGSSTSGLHTLSISKVEGLPVRLCSRSEQERIVVAIETHVSRLDASVASLQRAKANVKRARAAVLQAAVEGRLVATEAALARAEGRDYEPAAVLLARILAERKAAWKQSGVRGKYKEPVAPAVDGFHELPEGWCWASVEALTHPVRVVRYGILKPGPDAPGGLPYVKVKHMRGDVIAPLEELPRTTQAIWNQYRGAALGKGDVLMAIRGTYSRVALVPDQLVGANITQDSARIAPLPGCDRVYLRYCLLSQYAQQYFQRVARGVAVKGVNIGDLRPAPIALPPLAEQHRIVGEVDRRLSVLDALDAAIDGNLARCTRLRQSILQRAFDGRLVSRSPGPKNGAKAPLSRGDREFEPSGSAGFAMEARS
jgi:type I restriction enzyme S subunit